MSRSMRAPIILLFSLTLAAGAFAQDVVIENVTVISSSTPPPLANAHVLLRDGRVAAIDTKPLTAPANAVRLDDRGKFLTPGITDSHVHIDKVILGGKVIDRQSLAAR